MFKLLRFTNPERVLEPSPYTVTSRDLEFEIIEIPFRRTRVFSLLNSSLYFKKSLLFGQIFEQKVYLYWFFRKKVNCDNFKDPWLYNVMSVPLYIRL